LEMGTNARLSSDHSGLFEWPEKSLQEALGDTQILANVTVGNPKNTETAVWLYYHLKNVSDLIVAARHVVARLLRSGTQSAA
jgi:hypothetical protein